MMKKDKLGVWLLLGIILTGLGFISTIQSFMEVPVVSVPETILENYRKFRNVFFQFTLEWWVPFEIPSELKDILALYLFCSNTVYHYYKWCGILKEYGRLRVFLAGPFFLIIGIVFALDKNVRTQTPQYVLFYIGHIIAILIFGVQAAVFFIWNHFLIVNL